MSKTFVKHEAPNPKGVKTALFLGVLWAAVIALLWFGFRNSEVEASWKNHELLAEGGLLNFFGRFHVLLVHFPVGVLFLAAAMEFFGRFKKQDQIRGAIPFVLWIAFLSGIVATVPGYLLMGAEDTTGIAMECHLWTGLATVVFTLFALVFALKGKTVLYVFSLLVALLAVSAAGHFGGAMIHDDDYLTEFAPEPLKPLLAVGLGSAEETDTALEPTDPANSDPSQATDGEQKELPLAEQNVYTNFVVPIMEAKCTECHDENKTKGKLRLDTHQLMMAGADGSDFSTVAPGKPDDSELLVRVTLPKDDDDFMPPKGDGLTPEEIEILRLWIQAGATTETTVVELGEDPSIVGKAELVAKLHSEKENDSDAWIPEWDALSSEEKQTRLNEAMAAAEQHNFTLSPISAEDARLRVNVINASKEFGDEQLALLDPVAEQIAWLNLGRSQVTDQGMKVVNHMRNLERLHLEHTKVTDEGIAMLAPLSQLEYLNLYGTEVGNGIFEYFENMPRLRRVYVWQTKVDPSTARAFERAVNLEINTGVDLAAQAVEEQKKKEAEAPKPEPKPKVMKPKEEEKNSEAKPKPKPVPVKKPGPKAAPPKPK